MRGFGLRNGKKRLLIVGDTQQFGRTISLILDDAGNKKWTIRHTTYEAFRGMLSPQLFKETDLFILDLWRSYPTGIRAEGIAAAEQLARQNARFLVVSPLSIGQGEHIPGYWDIASTMPLSQHCEILLKDGNRKLQNVSEVLKIKLRRYLSVSTGHE